MEQQRIEVQGIPGILWGKPSESVYLFVHGKMANKEAAGVFARIAAEKGYQTVSFDLPRHGERLHSEERCDVWQGMEDLNRMADFVFSNWKHVCLYACSLGSYFSLQSFQDRPFERCLFQSPILDMEELIHQMMVWFDVSEERLQREREVETSIDLMTWDYYQYVKAHPTRKWTIPTSILYGGKDNLQSAAAIEKFVKRFRCALTVSENSEHPFMAESDFPIVERWLFDYIV